MDEYRQGQFHPLNERERLQETFELVKRLELRVHLCPMHHLLGKYSGNRDVAGAKRQA